MILHEHAKRVKDLRSQFYRLTRAEQTAFGDLQAKRAEFIDRPTPFFGHGFIMTGWTPHGLGP